MITLCVAGSSIRQARAPRNILPSAGAGRFVRSARSIASSPGRCNWSRCCCHGTRSTGDHTKRNRQSGGQQHARHGWPLRVPVVSDSLTSAVTESTSCCSCDGLSGLPARSGRHRRFAATSGSFAPIATKDFVGPFLGPGDSLDEEVHRRPAPGAGLEHLMDGVPLERLGRGGVPPSPARCRRPGRPVG